MGHVKKHTFVPLILSSTSPNKHLIIVIILRP